MSRAARDDADYFPFIAKDGRTLTLLQHRFELRGIGFFTNLMRLLTTTPGHHLNLSEEADRLYVFSKIGCSEEDAEAMLDVMVITGKIHKRLWEEARIIYSKDFVDSLSFLYGKRTNKPPTAEELEETFLSPFRSGNPDNRADIPLNPDNRAEKGHSDAVMPQSKGEERKEKDTRTSSRETGETDDPEISRDKVPKHYATVAAILRDRFNSPLHLSDLALLDDLFAKNYPAVINAQLNKLAERTVDAGKDPPARQVQYIHSYMRNWNKRMTNEQMEEAKRKQERANQAKSPKPPQKCDLCGSSHIRNPINGHAQCRDCDRMFNLTNGEWIPDQDTGKPPPDGSDFDDGSDFETYQDTGKTPVGDDFPDDPDDFPGYEDSG